MIKYLTVAAVALSVSACAGYQAKLNDAMAKAKDIKAKVECRAKVLDPYVDYILEQDIPAYLDGADVTDVLVVASVFDVEFSKVKAAFKACSAAE